MTTSKTNADNDEQFKTPMLTYCFAGIILGTAGECVLSREGINRLDIVLKGHFMYRSAPHAE